MEAREADVGNRKGFLSLRDPGGMATQASAGAPAGPCFWHPGTPGAAPCQICKRSACEACRVVLSNQSFCNVHGLKGHRMQSKQAW